MIDVYVQTLNKYKVDFDSIIHPADIADSSMKPFRDKIAEYDIKVGNERTVNDNFLNTLKDESLTPYDKKKLIKKLEKEMREINLKQNYLLK